ncbi:MAG: hypothetical protein P0Y49_15295 [Candidatus Pedobacter colombiensis]|uniref:Lipoprotein n=1 Tax=Candidatus Pedobacter colombiensis TaxID=3121371 RepID=A0AAJ5W4U9_9SPHI|nr:hypothetical protein [Pedobacter sp.]WEK18156.1 MAG: hypothetical protein P0Y49_15295 [Pedobacter sp.]
MNNFKTKPYLTLMIFALMAFFLISGCKAGLDNPANSSKEVEQANLIKLKNEIIELSKKVSCEDAKEWKFMPIGAKACGGPSDYISYSTKIDTNDFIKKVNFYTAESEKFNKKWGIVSDCTLLNPPKEIRCENGKAVLIY